MKVVGCCTFCSDPVFSVITTWTSGPLKGEPRRIGKATENAVRVDYVLSGGSTTSLTFCEKCSASAQKPENFPAIWRIVLEAFARELMPEFVTAIGNPPRTEDQQSAVEMFVAGLEQQSIVACLGAARYLEC